MFQLVTKFQILTTNLPLKFTVIPKSIHCNIKCRSWPYAKIDQEVLEHRYSDQKVFILIGKFHVDPKETLKTGGYEEEQA